MAVDLDGVPAEGAPFIGQRRDVHDVFHEAIELDAVVVHDGHHVIQLMERAGHGRFPDLPFLDLAVAQHHVGARRPPSRRAASPIPSASDRPSPSEPVEASSDGMKRMSGMALVNRAELAQGVQLVERGIGIAGLRHHGVEHRRGVSLGKNEAVAIRQGGILRIDVHVVEIQLHQNLHRRERPPGWPDSGGADHHHDFPPDSAWRWLAIPQWILAWDAFNFSICGPSVGSVYQRLTTRR